MPSQHRRDIATVDERGGRPTPAELRGGVAKNSKPDGGAPGATSRRRLSRRLIFALLTSACLLTGTGYVAVAVHQRSTSPDGAAAMAPRSGSLRGESGREPHVVFQHVARDANYAHVASASLARADARRTITPLVCERVYFAATRGLCLVPEQRPLGPSYIAKIFGPDFKVRHRVKLSGPPSRARISPDGRYGATTVWLFGHSYADVDFSTQTTLIDMATGRVVADNLENFNVTRDGTRIRSRDFNFWGVTFARDSHRFYATLRTGKRTYLVQGDVRTRSMRILHENVECPSLSPDNTRIAYKKRLGNTWRLHVLDLATMAETPLAETRGIDDQVEWLDDNRILYGLDADVWVVPANGGRQPQRLFSDALSPAVVRPE